MKNEKGKYEHHPVAKQPATYHRRSARLHELLKPRAGCDPHAVRDVLAKARQMEGLEADDVAMLMDVEDPDLQEEMFAAARLCEGRDLRQPARAVRAALHLQPL